MYPALYLLLKQLDSNVYGYPSCGKGEGILQISLRSQIQRELDTLGGPDLIGWELHLPGRDTLAMKKQTALLWTGCGKGRSNGPQSDNQSKEMDLPGTWRSLQEDRELQRRTQLDRSLGSPWVSRHGNSAMIHVCVALIHGICGNGLQHHSLGFYIIMIKQTNCFHIC